MCQDNTAVCLDLVSSDKEREEMTLPYLGYYVPLEENQRPTAAHIFSKRLNLPKAIEVGPISVGPLNVIGFWVVCLLTSGTTPPPEFLCSRPALDYNNESCLPIKYSLVQPL